MTTLEDRLIHHGQILSRPAEQPAETTHNVAYELAKRLYLNYSTSAVGSVEVAICDPDGRPLDGFGEMEPLFGDELIAAVPYDLSSLRGTPVRLRFRLQDADLFALRTGD